MPTVPTIAGSVSLADRRLLRAYPRIVKELTDTEDKMDRLELDGFLKLLPGAVERFEADSASNANSIEPSVLSAIQTITVSFGARNAVSVETETVSGNSNTPELAVETDAGVSSPDQPEGLDTDQSVASISLSRNGLEASAGNGGEAESKPERQRNARVRTRSPFSGRMAAALDRRRAAEKTADDQGGLSRPNGRKANGQRNTDDSGR